MKIFIDTANIDEKFEKLIVGAFSMGSHQPALDREGKGGLHSDNPRNL